MVILKLERQNNFTGTFYDYIVFRTADLDLLPAFLTENLFIVLALILFIGIIYIIGVVILIITHHLLFDRSVGHVPECVAFAEQFALLKENEGDSTDEEERDLAVDEPYNVFKPEVKSKHGKRVEGRMGTQEKDQGVNPKK